MDQEVRNIQLKCIEMLDMVDAICRKHSIEYSLCGGSVVGAHLYKGCLPWDDDVDLMMSRVNYNRFVNIVQSELPEGFTLHNYQVGNDFYAPFSKIYNDNTTIVQNDGTVTGVFLDITVYDRIPTNRILSSVDVFLWKLSQIVMIGKVEPKSFSQRVRNLALSTILHSRRGYLRFFQWAVELLSHFGSYHYSELFGAFANTTAFRPSVFENYADIEFEGKQYRVVRDYIEYLQTRYNRTDFREPKEKQVAPHYKFVNLNLPYREYVKENRVD